MVCLQQDHNSRITQVTAENFCCFPKDIQYNEPKKSLDRMKRLTCFCLIKKKGGRERDTKHKGEGNRRDNDLRRYVDRKTACILLILFIDSFRSCRNGSPLLKILFKKIFTFIKVRKRSDMGPGFPRWLDWDFFILSNPIKWLAD